jgi:Asp-tRNA(Asn)/Glu-tRNA(Gln) amidotransferase A subunit family amidase
VIRPAAFCGVVGYKPSHGKVPSVGVHPLAPSLDHIGFFARTVEGAAVCHALFVDANPDAIADLNAWSEYFTVRRPSKMGVVRTPFWERVSDEQKANFEATLARLQASGATLVELDPFDSMPSMLDALQTILQVEAARAVGPAAAEHPDLISQHMRALTTAGAAVPAEKYAAALELQARMRNEYEAWIDGCDAIVTVPATGPAPEGLADTGDATFCAPWSLLGVPAVTVPSGRSQSGLPLGFQVLGRQGDDLQTLQTAAWIETVLG